MGRCAKGARTLAPAQGGAAHDQLCTRGRQLCLAHCELATQVLELDMRPLELAELVMRREEPGAQLSRLRPLLAHGLSRTGECGAHLEMGLLLCPRLPRRNVELGMQRRELRAELCGLCRRSVRSAMPRADLVTQSRGLVLTMGQFRANRAECDMRLRMRQRCKILIRTEQWRPTKAVLRLTSARASRTEGPDSSSFRLDRRFIVRRHPAHQECTVPAGLS